MMIVYIGNKLSAHGINPTGVEYLGNKLADHFKVVTASDKKNKLLRLLDMLFTIYKNRKKATLVLIDTYSTLNFTFAYYSAWLCRFLNIPFVPIIRGGDFETRIKKTPGKAAFVLKKSYATISPSPFIQQQLNEHSYTSTYIPNFISIDEYPYKKRREIKPDLLYVRSLDEIYNPKMALKVVSLLAERHPGIRLCFVGPDKNNNHKALKSFSEELSIQHHVTFKGKLSKQEWVRLSEDYDIFLNPTNFDNMPVSIIEAMALGFPIVSTDAGGIPFLITNEHDGLLVKKNDPQAMAQQIEKLLTNPDLAEQLSVNARKKAETFDWESIKNDWIDLINNARSK